VDLEECLSYARSLASIVKRIAGECSCIILSGGIDTTFIALTHPSKERLRAVTAESLALLGRG